MRSSLKGINYTPTRSMAVAVALAPSRRGVAVRPRHVASVAVISRARAHLPIFPSPRIVGDDWLVRRGCRRPGSTIRLTALSKRRPRGGNLTSDSPFRRKYDHDCAFKV